ncbi:hypothetical protein ACFE04_015125 [Oxalis oulophora]
METEPDLVRLCINAACESKETVEKGFKYSVETINLRGNNLVDAEWIAYIGAFSSLHYLDIADCHRINSSALWPLSGMATLKELNLSGCTKVTDAGINHLLSISTLEKLWIALTGVTTKGVALLSSLLNLSLLDLGGLPVTDETLRSLKVLTKLEYLDLWGSKVSDEGVTFLPMLTELKFLNIAWTNVTNVPAMSSSLKCLNLSNCNINSILKEIKGDKAHLAKLLLSGSTFANEDKAFLYIEKSSISFLDLSTSSLSTFTVLSLMNSLEYLNLSSTMFGDDSVRMIVSIGAKLRDLNLRKTRVSSAGVGVLAGHVPNLETLSLSHTEIDDTSFSYISMMPLLKDVDLSNTNVRGYIQQPGVEPVLSLTMLEGLTSLESLNLEHTQIQDDALHPLSRVQNLKHLYLKSPLTDNSLYQMSTLSKLTNLTIRDAVLTSYALASFMAPTTLQFMDLRGCWLLTEDVISSFCKTYPQIEVRHEFVRVSPKEQFSSPSPSRIRTTPSDKMKGKIPLSNSFVDQRLKYSREELLALQFSALSVAYPQVL